MQPGAGELKSGFIKVMLLLCKNISLNLCLINTIHEEYEFYLKKILFTNIDKAILTGGLLLHTFCPRSLDPIYGVT